MLKIRRVRGPDWAHEIYDLQAKCLPHDTQRSVDAGDWWIATEEDEAIAFGCLTPSGRFDDCGYLALAGVVASHRGRGIQKRLIRVRIARARQLAYKTLFTDTRDNPASANALITCGFRMYWPTLHYGVDNTLYWRLKLLP